MQNKTDKGTSLVSKLLPVAISNSVNRLSSVRKKKYYDSRRASSAVSLSRRSRQSLSGRSSSSGCPIHVDACLAPYIVGDPYTFRVSATDIRAGAHRTPHRSSHAACVSTCDRERLR